MEGRRRQLPGGRPIDEIELLLGEVHQRWCWLLQRLIWRVRVQ